jgi:hypothetical protein
LGHCPRGVAAGETVEQIQPDLIIPTGERKGRNPSVASIYRALAAHEKAQAYPDAVEQAHAEHARLSGDIPANARPRSARVLDLIDPELAARIQGAFSTGPSSQAGRGGASDYWITNTGNPLLAATAAKRMTP